MGALARGRKKFVDKRTDFKNEVNSLLDQQGITYNGSLWTNEGREFLAELTLDGPSQLLLKQWLEAIDEFTAKIKRMQRKIEKVATSIDEMEFLLSAPTFWATRMLPATEIPIPSKMSKNTIEKPKLITASVFVLYWPTQKVSARLYAV